MSDPNVTKLVTWLRQQTKIARPLGDVTRFELRHLPVNNKRGHEVQGFDPPPADATEEWYEMAAQSMLTAAELDCINLTGPSQSYVIVAFRGEKAAEKIDARYPLPRVHRPQDDNDSSESFESEPATKTGVLSQLMRHNAELARINSSMVSSITNTQARMLARMADQIEKHQQQRAETFEMLEDLEGRKQERAIEIMKVETRQKMIAEALPTAKLLGASIATKLTGRQFGQNPAQTLAAELYKSLTEEQIEKLGQILNAGQITAIGALMLPEGESGEH
jgi:hypothetical protein